MIEPTATLRSDQPRGVAKPESRGASRPLDVDEALGLFQAYRQGLVSKQMRPGARMLDFTPLVSHALLDWPLTIERSVMHEVSRQSYLGVVAARGDDHERARRHFETARQGLERLDGGLEQLGVALHEAAVAYLDHREGRPDKARERVIRVMDADLLLEREHDLTTMLVHRIQQGHNLSRVDLRRGRRREALERAGQLLAFLEDKTDSLPFHRDWCGKTLRSLPGHLVRGMIGQIAGEMAAHITTGGDDAEWRVLLDAARPEPPARTTRFPQVQHALCAQAARLDGDHRRWIDHLERFFARGPALCAELFYASVVGLTDACRTVDTRWGRQMVAALCRDASKWRGCSPFLLHRLHADPCAS